VDCACAVAHWEDENYQYEKSKEEADEEAKERARVLEQHRNTLNG